MRRAILIAALLLPAPAFAHGDAGHWRAYQEAESYVGLPPMGFIPDLLLTRTPRHAPKGRNRA